MSRSRRLRKQQLVRASAQRDAIGAPSVDTTTEVVSVDATTEVVTVSASLQFSIRAAEGARKFRVRVMGTGFGANFENGRQWYVPDSPEGIGSAKRTFAGAKVHYHRDDSGEFDHRDGSALSSWMDTDHEVGHLTDLALSDDGIEASLVLHDDVPDEIVEVIAARKVGLSIEAVADRRPSIRGGKAVVELVNFRHGPDGPASVALVTHPALRGEILRVAASRRSPDMNRDQALAVLASSTSTPEQVAEARRVIASTSPSPTPAPAPAVAVADDPVVKAARDRAEKAAIEAEAVARTMKVTAAKARLEGLVTASRLPEDAGAFVRDMFVGTIEASASIDEGAVGKAIDAQRAILAKRDPGVGVGATGAVVTASQRDKVELALERLVMNNAPDYALKAYAERHHGGKLLAAREREAGIGHSDREHSFRAMFRRATGFEINDLWKSRDMNRKVVASIDSTTFNDAWENVLNRAVLAYYENPDFSAWRSIVRITSFNDIRKKERIVKGGYGNLPAVAQGANYNAATTPADQGHGWTPAKYGYTEQWTREAMMNDDVGLLADIPRSMGLAAARTLYEYVFDQLTIAGQPTMDYDSTALYHANHGGNLLTTALATGLPAARLVMKKQADLSSGKRLGVIPRFLLVPEDLAETAWNLLKPSTEEPGGLTTERAWLRQMNLGVIVVRHWTNTTDWVLAASPTEFPTFELGFEGGMEEPQLYVQEDRNFGSMFERDAVTVKLAHGYYGGTPVRHEGFVGNDV